MADHSHAGDSPAELRVHPRLPLQKNLLLVARGMNQRACQMKDICAGGALVEMLDGGGSEGRSLRRGEVVLLRLLLGEGESASTQELRARIAHADGHLFGVSFFNPDPATLSRLLEAAGAAPAPPPELSANARELLERLGQQVLGFCASTLGPFFRDADELLLASAEHAHNSDEQRLFFEAATRLRKERDDLRARFLKELAAAFAAPAVASSDSLGHTQGDREQFQEWLVVKVMAARAEERCHGVLTTLQTRLDALAGSAVRQSNPFGPLPVCLAFQTVMARLQPAPAVEKVLYRSFEETVIEKLPGLYELLNSTLAQNNVLPRLAATPVPQVDAGTTDSGATAATTVAAVPAARVKPGGKPPPPRSAAEFLERTGRPPAVAVAGGAGGGLDAVRQLLALHRQVAASADASTPGAATLPLEVAEASRVVTMLKAAHDGWKPALEKLAQHAGTPAAGSTLLAMQHFAESIVQHLAQGEQQGEAARDWFRRLELPLFYVLLTDGGFYRDREHPLRQILDRLTRLGLRDCPLAAGQRKSVEELVTRLAREFDSDRELFGTLLQELEPLAAWLEQSCRRNTERACLMAEGENRLAVARQRVQEALDTRLAGKRVPQAVLTLLEAGWRDLLVTTSLRDGEHSARWKEFTGVLDELLAIAADVHRRFDLRDLLRQLKAGMQEGADVNGRLQQQAVVELKQLLSGPQRLLGDVEWVQVPARRDEGDTSLERWLQKWLERTHRLQPGDWLELRHRGAGAECLRLAWRSDDGSRFLFVNRLGVKANSFSDRELAALMHAGNVLACDGERRSPVDDALEAAGYGLYERLAWQVTHDPLTGLANSAEFMRQVGRALDAAKRQRAHHVLACIRLDRFDDIHNTARAVAEELLRSVAHLLGKALAPRMMVARLQDDEFALLLEDCELGKAQQLFSMRLGELAAMRLNFEGEIYQLTASAGLVDITYTSDTPAQVLRAARDACAEARRHGGNRIQVYQPSNEERARRDGVVVWVAKLNEALEAERLALRCQRIQPLAAGSAAGEQYEILLGMREDGGENLPPSEFVQAAERYNRMLAVDRWVVEHTLRWLKEHPAELERLGMVSINLSAHSLTEAQTLGFLLDRVLEHGIPPEKLCFEISETAAITHLADAVDLMQELRRIGCRFALDDFGAGHLSCHHLRHLPLDFLKIDGAFVRGMGSDAADDIMVRAIHALAHFFGLATMAENVEDEAVLQRLREVGVDHAQGYGIERPRWLEEN
jgi:diguanylate cyclase (GGDEF)-like protein